MERTKVAVLMGGTSSERDISLSTGKQILSALDPSRYDGFVLNDVFDLVASDVPRPDVVFIALHGKGGEDGTVQGTLELLGIPYTGSGVLASALAMDKSRAKQFLKAHGVPVAEEILLTQSDCGRATEIVAQIEDSFGFPAIVKPNEGGSTIGCTILHSVSDLEPALSRALIEDATALIEPLISGVEITVGALGGDEPVVLPCIEIVPGEGFYDYEAKYAVGGSLHIIPARISETAQSRAERYARIAHQRLGCRGMSRTDMIVVGDQPYVLEVNTIPGMTPTSLLPEAAKAAGIDFPELLSRLISDALARK